MDRDALPQTDSMPAFATSNAISQDLAIWTSPKHTPPDIPPPYAVLLPSLYGLTVLPPSAAPHAGVLPPDMPLCCHAGVLADELAPPDQAGAVLCQSPAPKHNHGLERCHTSCRSSPSRCTSALRDSNRRATARPSRIPRRCCSTESTTACVSAPTRSAKSLVINALTSDRTDKLSATKASSME